MSFITPEPTPITISYVGEKFIAARPTLVSSGSRIALLNIYFSASIPFLRSKSKTDFPAASYVLHSARINGCLQLKDFKKSIAWLLSITTISIGILLKDYIKNEDLTKEYNGIVERFEMHFKDLL